MKTYKGMLSVVWCWCLCLSLCSLSLAENATAEKPVEEQHTITQDAVKIALEKERLSKGKEKEIMRKVKEQEETCQYCFISHFLSIK